MCENVNHCPISFSNHEGPSVPELSGNGNMGRLTRQSVDFIKNSLIYKVQARELYTNVCLMSMSFVSQNNVIPLVVIDYNIK